jgi:hypothetical protein
MRRLHDADYWYGDYAELIPAEVSVQLAAIQADMAVAADAADSEDDYLLNSYGVRLGKPLSVPSFAKLISEVMWCYCWDGGYSESLDHLIKGLDSSLAEPQTCAKLMSKRSLLRTSIPVIQSDARDLLANCRGLGRRSKPRDAFARKHWHLIQSFVDLASSELETGNVKHSLNGFDQIYTLAAVEKRHPLYPTDYALFVRPSQSRIILDPIDEITREAKSNPALLRRISPREFELFLRNIFKGFGFEVELTAQTRDGGVDLLCMSYAHGIPLKIAVEAKRYSEDRPISVELVRSFVGANQEIRANKLVYVTTSRYTRDAVKYANLPGVVELLELKEFPDIVKWAQGYTQSFTAGV